MKKKEKKRKSNGIKLLGPKAKTKAIKPWWWLLTGERCKMLSKGIGTMATTATMAARSLSIAHIPRHKPRLVFTPLSFSSSASKARKLVLYSKPGCCLCDGLKEKLHAAFSLSGPASLNDVVLQVKSPPHTLNLYLYKDWNLENFGCWVLLVGEGYYQQSWVGEGIPIWDTRFSQITLWWHWG